MKRRDQTDKRSVPMTDLGALVKEELDKMQVDLFEAAKKLRTDKTVRVDSYADFLDVMKDDNKLVVAHWDGTRETEAKVKEDTKATIRCIPFEGQGVEIEPGECMVSGKPSPQRVLWARAY